MAQDLVIGRGRGIGGRNGCYDAVGRVANRKLDKRERVWQERAGVCAWEEENRDGGGGRER